MWILQFIMHVLRELTSISDVTLEHISYLSPVGLTLMEKGLLISFGLCSHIYISRDNLVQFAILVCKDFYKKIEIINCKKDFNPHCLLL